MNFIVKSSFAQAVTLLLVLGCYTIQAQTPAFTYQGRLTDGAIATNGNYDLQFMLFDSLAAGTQIGSTQTVSNVAVSAGIFNVQLDFGANAFPGANRWLQIAARVNGTPTFTTLAPRQPITSTPYAIRSLNASSADTVTVNGVPSGSGNYIQNTASLQAGSFNINGNGFIGGTVGIGTTTPGAGTKLDVNGPVQFRPGGSGGGFINFATPNAETGLTINGSGTPRADIRFDGATLKLLASTGSLPPTTNGIIIGTNGSVGIGVDTVTTNAKLTLKSSTTNSGVTVFQIKSSDDTTQFAVTDSGGVYVPSLALGPTAGHVCRNLGFLSPCASAAEYVPTVKSDSAYPEAADLVSIVGANPYADQHAPFAVGRSNKACDENLIGFLLKPELGADGIKLNDSYLPLAIFGYFPAKVTMENGTIKRGDPITSSSKPGYGMKTTQACKIIGYALEDAKQEGTIQIFANLSEYSAQPVARLQADNAVLNEQQQSQRKHNAAMEERLSGLEQENKYLVHSSVQSLDTTNRYDGTVTTDANGEAQITLPVWFTASNRDFRYQLTSIGAFAQSIIAEKIKDNRFKIKTSLPNVEVSWQVTGIRQDARENQNRLTVEELKPTVERGSYQNPTAFGQPVEKH